MSAIEAEVIVGDARLILGDMRAVLPELEERADLVLSDPPYRLTSGGNASSELKGCFGRGRYDNGGALFDLVEWSDMAPLIYDACAPDADAIIMASDREEAVARLAFEAAGFRFHRLLIWHKGTATPNRWYMPNVELALYLWRGHARAINDCASKAMITCPQVDVSADFLPDDVPAHERVSHATEKPVSLMRHWLANSTDPGGLVLDPFMGTGSTVVAAIEAGRRAIGIEKDPKWFDVAVKRAERASRVWVGLDFASGPSHQVEFPFDAQNGAVSAPRGAGGA